MKPLIKYLANVVLFVLCFTTAKAQQDNPDPLALLQKADSTLRQIRTISYHIEHFTIGEIKVGDQIMPNQGIFGNVSISKLSTDDPIGALVAVNQTHFYKSKEIEGKVGYDGKKVYMLDSREKELYVNDPDSTGLMLLSFTQLIFEAFKNPTPLQAELAAKEIKFDGYAIVNNVPCNVIFVQYEDSTSNRSAWWFLGANDYLPHKVISRYVWQEQDITAVLTFSDIKVNSEIDDSVFQINAPEGYEIKEFKLPLVPGVPAPDWTLSDTDGKKWSLSDFKGQIVVLDFWATWCKPCIAAMPKLQELHEQYRDNGIKVIGISTWERDDPAKLMAQKNLNYQLLLNGEKIAEEYGVMGLPTLFIIDVDGNIVHSEFGYNPEAFDKIVKIVKNSLASK